MSFTPDPAADRKSVEDICDILHVWGNTRAKTPKEALIAAENALIDICAALHESPNQDFGSMGEACVVIRNGRPQQS